MAEDGSGHIRSGRASWSTPTDALAFLLNQAPGMSRVLGRNNTPNGANVNLVLIVVVKGETLQRMSSRLDRMGASPMCRAIVSSVPAEPAIIVPPTTTRALT